ncbi:MAG TPA: hypothetical protein VNF05_05080 [Acidimicrobiales bacterium]|nr:hypothetical protein [Acidimicrobiales bacterium]
MNDKDYTTTFTVSESPAEVFAAINNVRSWWAGDIEGSTDHLGDEFTYRYEDLHYSKQKIVELTPGKRVVWLVTDSHLSFTENSSEWTGTRITFDVSTDGDNTVIRFAHVGLVPEFECFSDCSNGWNFYINGSLRDFIATAIAQPDPLQ